jgi:hypothetical protein
MLFSIQQEHAREHVFKLEPVYTAMQGCTIRTLYVLGPNHKQQAPAHGPHVPSDLAWTPATAQHRHHSAVQLAPSTDQPLLSPAQQGAAAATPQAPLTYAARRDAQRLLPSFSATTFGYLVRLYDSRHRDPLVSCSRRNSRGRRLLFRRLSFETAASSSSVPLLP